MIYTSGIVPALYTYCETVNLNLYQRKTEKHHSAERIIRGNSVMNITVVPIKTLFNRRTCEIVRRSINKELPAPFDNYFKTLSHKKSTRSNNISIKLPMVKTEQYEMDFTIKGDLFT